jgi:hypothetical protein
MATAAHGIAIFAAGRMAMLYPAGTGALCTVLRCDMCHVYCASVLQERDAVLGSLARRAATLVAGLNQLEGVSCNAAEGALYAFPRYGDAAVVRLTCHPCLRYNLCNCVATYHIHHG